MNCEQTRIYFICGFIGSGKTTFSKKLAKEHSAFRFSPDEWMIPLFGEHMEREVFDARLNTIVSLFKKSALELIQIDVPVVFDFGFWKKTDREEMISWAEQMGLSYEMIYLDVSFEECCRRAYKRNSEREDQSFEMTPEMMSLFWSWFEVPSEDEGYIRWVNCDDVISKGD